jgi:hypothetical protein
MSENHSSPKGKGLSLPGQPTEEAFAKVGSAAGKSLVRGLGKLGNAYVGEWAAKREAKAEALRLAIETDAKVKADTALATVRREQELAEFEHRAALERRAARFRVEMAREQINLEAIERRAIEFTERAPESGDPREIDEDWLFKFADLAQKVSDDDVQALWARALSSAAMQGAPRLSAAALQTLGLFDKNIAESFKSFVAVRALLGFLPFPPTGEGDPQNIDIATLSDLGLIESVLYKGVYQFDDFSFEESERVGKLPADLQTHYALTLRGKEIANAVFRRSEDLSLSEEHEQHYLRIVLMQQFEHKPAVTILSKLGAGDQPPMIRLTQINSLTKAVEEVDWKSMPATQALSTRLRNLLLWAEQTHDIQIK